MSLLPSPAPTAAPLPVVCVPNPSRSYFSTIAPLASVKEGVLPVVGWANSASPYFSTVSAIGAPSTVNVSQVSSIVNMWPLEFILLGTGNNGSLSYVSSPTQSTISGCVGSVLPAVVSASTGRPYFS